MTLTLESAVQIMNGTRDATQDAFEQWWGGEEAAIFRGALERVAPTSVVRSLAYMAWMDGLAHASLENLARIKRENAEMAAFLPFPKIEGVKQ
jgi:hypothetical protein